jgi:hypothetical protein
MIPMAHAGGRPPKWTDPQILQGQIDSYFGSITRMVPVKERVIVGYEDPEQRKPIYEERQVINCNGDPAETIEWLQPPTMVGLARYLGVDRMTLLNYRNMDEFFAPLREAKTRVEEYEAMRLVTTANPKGIEFSLKNNHDYRDTTETVITGQLQHTRGYDLSQMSTEDKRQLADLMSKALAIPGE